jgi:oxygen-independent coproporphyrinogen-3 oxidase
MMEEVQTILGFGAGTITKKVANGGMIPKLTRPVNAGIVPLVNENAASCTLGELIRSGGELNLDISRCENYREVKDYTERLPELIERKKQLFDV